MSVPKVAAVIGAGTMGPGLAAVLARAGSAILRECLSLVERGIVSEADLDTCVKWGIGYKLAVIGPMRLLDLAGLERRAEIAQGLIAVRKTLSALSFTAL